MNPLSNGCGEGDAEKTYSFQIAFPTPALPGQVQRVACLHRPLSSHGRTPPAIQILTIFYSHTHTLSTGRCQRETTSLPPGEKTEVVQKAIQQFAGPFHVGELQKKCPEVSLDMIRNVLKTSDLIDAIDFVDAVFCWRIAVVA